MNDQIPDYRRIRLSARPPRMATIFDAGEDWQTDLMDLLALTCRMWGGAGHVFIPKHAKGEVKDAFWRLLRTFDPDVVAAYPHRVVEQLVHERILRNCAPLHNSDNI